MMSWYLIAYDRQTKSGSSCLHKFNFNGIFAAFKEVFQAHPGFWTHLVALGLLGYWWLGLTSVWHSLKLKIVSSGTSSLQREYTKVMKPYIGVEGWTTHP